MSYAYVIFGAGRQGVAIAYDLARTGEAERVLLADADANAARAAVERIRRLLPAGKTELVARTCDVSRPVEVAAAIAASGTRAPASGTGCEPVPGRAGEAGVQPASNREPGRGRPRTVVISAVPYRFNLDLTEAAIAAGASFCDLGGNTAVVRQQLRRHDAAVAAGVSVVPDCGLAPGLGNLLAAHGIGEMDSPQHVHVRCGGLPERPVGPLGYKLLFHFQGLINEYSGFGEFLRDGRRVEIPALTELEEIEFPAPVGRCEAAVTSGGTSTCAESFAGRLRSYDYKTVRYPGHFAVVRALFELGCFEERIELRDGSAIEPKAVLRRLMEERLAFPDVRDVVVLRVTIRGVHGGRPRAIQYDLFERHDEATGFTAMERTTGFPTAVIAHMQARRRIAPGARPAERCVPTGEFMEALGRRGVRIARTES